MVLIMQPPIHPTEEGDREESQDQPPSPPTVRSSSASDKFIIPEPFQLESLLFYKLPGERRTEELPLLIHASNSRISDCSIMDKNNRQKRRRKRWSIIGSYLILGAMSISAAMLLHFATDEHHRCQTTSTRENNDLQLTKCNRSANSQTMLFSLDPMKVLRHTVQTYIGRSRGESSSNIMDYLQLFRWSNQSASAPLPLLFHINEHNESSSTSSSHRPSRFSEEENRHLLGITEDPSDYPQLVVAGKMTIEDGLCNIGQFNLHTKEWSKEERIQLSLYNSYSGGEVYSLLANHTSVPSSYSSDSSSRGDDQVVSDTSSSRSSARRFEGSGELIVVGAFDTTYRNSQVTYCSVGEWNGKQLSKVGEGLCNSGGALSKGMKITTSALAGPYDVFVAGSFQTQVWNGDRHEFVKIFNIAHYNAVEQVWLPLEIGQITCSWCTVTVLALAWDSKRRQLHIAGKFNAIDGRNVPAGLAIYNVDSGHLVAHPGGGLTMKNQTQDGVGTALQLDEERGVVYVMGSFERLTATGELCGGLAAYEIKTHRWTCLADPAHTVLPTGGGNMLLTPHGLMVAGKTATSTTWPDATRPYTIALLKATLKTAKTKKKIASDDDDSYVIEERDTQYHAFNWSWLPGFNGHDEPLHAMSNGFADYEGAVFIAGDNLVAKWHKEAKTSSSNSRITSSVTSSSSSEPEYVPVTEILSKDSIRGSIMAISQMMPKALNDGAKGGKYSNNLTIIVYGVAVGCIIGMLGAILCNRNVVFPFLGKNQNLKGISLDTLTYSALENSSITEAYQRAMNVRHVKDPHLLTIIDPQEIFLQRIIGEGTFGRVWSARWSTASVAVKEFVFAQAAVAGKSSMQQEIVEEIIGEAGMMAILRHPNVLQLFGCSLTAQAIWIVSELCSLGSLRQVLDDNDRVLPVEQRLSMALQVAEGMTYLHNQTPPIIHRDLKSHNIFVHETFTDAPVKPKVGFGSWKNKRKNNSDSNKPEKAAVPNTNNAGYAIGRPEKMKTNFTLVAKIGDWGSARATLSGSRTMTHGVGTACWLAPEVIKHARSSKFSDVYGYGIILWELATREEVYQGLETTQIIAKVANESLRPPVPQDCPWKHVMVKCWEENPNDRLEFSAIVRELKVIAKKLAETQAAQEEIAHRMDQDGSDKMTSENTDEEDKAKV